MPDIGGQVVTLTFEVSTGSIYILEIQVAEAGLS